MIAPALYGARSMRCLLLLALLFACSEARERPPGNPPRGSDAGPLDGSSDDAGTTDDAGTNDDPPLGLALFGRLAGLWSGPATQTPLGNFTMMNVDFRAATDQFMFGRVDVDESNALRFGFSLETHGGKDVLTYRNGGYFLGLQRDDRTELVEHDEAALTWRFCHVEQGCSYIDALYDFEAEDRLIFDVMVRGEQHVYWDARRLETREIPPDFAEGLVTQGTGTAPFPEMPGLRTTVSWSAPLTAQAPVWMVLSVSDCSPTSCVISRQLRAIAPAGATSVELFLEQVHPGDYKVLAVLDRNANLDQTLAPDSGDGVSLPNSSLTIAVNGETTTSVPIVFDLP